MRTIVTLALLAPFVASAQLEPTVEHYEAAANAIAVQRAAANLLAFEEAADEAARVRRDRLARSAEVRELRARLVALWGAEVRRRRGGDSWPAPGDGWHEVHRGD